MLKQRVMTAAILIPLTLLVLYYLPPAAFCILTALIILACAWEWGALMQLSTRSQRWCYVGFILLMLVAALFILIPNMIFVASLWWIITIVLLIMYSFGFHEWLNGKTIRALMGVLVLIPCWGAINFIRNESYGFEKLLFLLVLIWGADSCAYFAGKLWGKHKLAPTISPGKSVQGAGAALIFAAIYTLGSVLFLKVPQVQWLACIIISLATVVFSIIGDLFESMLKRHAKLKDSGNLLPGHGGLLDRLDSLTAAAPIFVMGTILLTQAFK